MNIRINEIRVLPRQTATYAHCSCQIVLYIVLDAAVFCALSLVEGEHYKAGHNAG